MRKSDWFLLSQLFVARIAFSPLLGGLVSPNFLSNHHPWQFLGAWEDNVKFEFNGLFDESKPLSERLLQTFKGNEIEFEPLTNIYQYLLFCISGKELNSRILRIGFLLIHLINSLLLLPKVIKLLNNTSITSKVTRITDYFEPDAEDGVKIVEKEENEVGKALALLFMVHPVFVESVFWPSRGGATLAMTFSLLTVTLALKGFEAKEREASMVFYVTGFFCYALALGSSLLAAPLGCYVVLLILLRGNCRPIDLACVANFGMLSFVSLLAVFVSRLITDVSDILNFSWLEQICLIPHVFLKSIQILVFPYQLTPHYTIPVEDLVKLLIPTVATVLVLSYGLMKRTKQPMTLISLFFFGFSVMWSSKPFQNQATLTNDSIVGFSSIFLLKPLLQLLQTIKWTKETSIAVVSLTSLILTCLTLNYTQTFNNPTTLYKGALSVNPGDWHTLQRVGDELFVNNAVEEAKTLFFLCNEFAPPTSRGVKLGLLRAKWFVLLGQQTEACRIYAYYFEQLAAKDALEGMIYGNYALCSVMGNHNEAARLNAKALFQLALGDRSLSIVNKNAIFTNLERLNGLQDGESFEAVLLY